MMTSTHTCGGTILTGHVEGESYDYCDRCGAYAYQGLEMPGTAAPGAAQRAWDRGDTTSPAGALTLEARHIPSLGWVVDDEDGGRWVPSHEAQTEIEAADDPQATAVQICTESPMRGSWRA